MSAPISRTASETSLGSRPPRSIAVPPRSRPPAPPLGERRPVQAQAPAHALIGKRSELAVDVAAHEHRRPDLDEAGLADERRAAAVDIPPSEAGAAERRLGQVEAKALGDDQQ